ncbi:GNAT family N-acetyltransferase [Amycolatopsis benzoatilytica]|uniref:GNAT family N-acetyltransferase n=1 Tax=Amycolatopsis benzoatilytica TaxID=346045 RepID=UPI0003825F0D|nr:GNAT family N-acetyltransferase [Amycolatopsis benzoatilytica]
MNPVIARVTPESVPHLVASAAALFAEDGGRRDPLLDTSWPAREGQPYYGELADDPNALCLLAFPTGEPAAAAIGHLVGRLRRHDPLRPGTVAGVLESMRVAPGHRRSGLGTALADEFAAWARDNAADYLSVTAYAANESALAFYRARGFVPFESTLHAPG